MGGSGVQVVLDIMPDEGVQVRQTCLPVLLVEPQHIGTVDLGRVDVVACITLGLREVNGFRVGKDQLVDLTARRPISRLRGIDNITPQDPVHGANIRNRGDGDGAAVLQVGISFLGHVGIISGGKRCETPFRPPGRHPLPGQFATKISLRGDSSEDH